MRCTSSAAVCKAAIMFVSPKCLVHRRIKVWLSITFSLIEHNRNERNLVYFGAYKPTLTSKNGEWKWNGEWNGRMKLILANNGLP